MRRSPKHDASAGSAPGANPLGAPRSSNPAAWALLVGACIVIATLGAIFLLVPRDPAITSSDSDCVRGAPGDCVAGTVESSFERGFTGYIYCACVMPSGEAKGFLAADSAVHSVDDPGARAGRQPNPAVTFPVGAAHR